MKKSISVLLISIAFITTNCKKEVELNSQFQPILGTWQPISQEYGSWSGSLIVPINYDRLVITDRIGYYKTSNSSIIEEGSIKIQSQSEKELLIGFVPDKVDELMPLGVFRMSVYVKFIGTDTLNLFTKGVDGGYMFFLFKRIQE
jgi:hypothetical protein